MLFILILITIIGSLISLITILPGYRLFTNIMFFLVFFLVFWNISKIVYRWLFLWIKNIKFISFYLFKFRLVYWGFKSVFYICTILISVCLIIKFKRDFIKEFINFFSPLPYIYFFVFIISLPVITLRILSADSSREEIKNISKNENNLPNIIFIIFDALSAEHMSLYGYKEKTTPFIDKFAKNSYVFKPLISVSNYTPTSVMSIYSSLYPMSHKVYAFYQFPAKEVIEEKNIFKFFRDKGYKIFTIIQNPLSPIYSFELEKYSNYVFFSDFLKYPLPLLVYIGSILGHKFKIHVFSFLFIFLNEILEDERTGLYFINFLKKTPFPIDTVFKKAYQIIKKEKKPLFILLHFYCPHDPFLPPGIESHPRFNSPYKQLKYLYRSHLHKDSIYIGILRKLYDENIKYIDREFEKFIKNLKEIKKFDNTVIVITSDHGESFSPRFVGHNTPYLYTNELIKVPLIIKFPDSGYKYIEKDGSIVDIFPTLLDLLGFKKPEWIEGISLFDSLQSKFLYCGYFQYESRFTQDFENSTLCVIKDSFKFYFDAKSWKYGLYNFISDPYDKKEISKFYPQKVKEFFEFIRKNFL